MMNQKFWQKIVNAFINNENFFNGFIIGFLIGGICGIVILDLVIKGIL